MSQTLITIRMDEQVKRNFEYICNELGLNMSTAINIFAKTVCREQGIPFGVSLKTNANNQTKKENDYMASSPQYTVNLYPECNPANKEIDSIIAYKSKFDDFEEAFDFLVNKSKELESTYEESGDNYLRKSAVFFDIVITNLRSHKYVIQFGIEGLVCVKDDFESFPLDDTDKAFEDVEGDEENTSDGIFYRIVYSFIRGLLG